MARALFEWLRATTLVVFSRVILGIAADNEQWWPQMR
jgi:hypothetical protein